jgi:hypothetical protein
VKLFTFVLTSIFIFLLSSCSTKDKRMIDEVQENNSIKICKGDIKYHKFAKVAPRIEEKTCIVLDHTSYVAYTKAYLLRFVDLIAVRPGEEVKEKLNESERMKNPSTLDTLALDAALFHQIRFHLESIIDNPDVTYSHKLDFSYDAPHEKPYQIYFEWDYDNDSEIEMLFSLRQKISDLDIHTLLLKIPFEYKNFIGPDSTPHLPEVEIEKWFFEVLEIIDSDYEFSDQ